MSKKTNSVTRNTEGAEGAEKPAEPQTASETASLAANDAAGGEGDPALAASGDTSTADPGTEEATAGEADTAGASELTLLSGATEVPAPETAGATGSASPAETASVAASDASVLGSPVPVAFAQPDMIRVTGPEKGRRRIGRRFGPEPVDLVIAELSAEDFAALAADPELTVSAMVSD